MRGTKYFLRVIYEIFEVFNKNMSKKTTKTYFKVQPNFIYSKAFLNLCKHFITCSPIFCLHSCQFLKTKESSEKLGVNNCVFIPDSQLLNFLPSNSKKPVTLNSLNFYNFCCFYANFNQVIFCFLSVILVNKNVWQKRSY